MINRRNGAARQAVEYTARQAVSWYIDHLSLHFGKTSALWEILLCTTESSQLKFPGPKQYDFLSAVANALSDLEKPTLRIIAESLVTQNVIPQRMSSDDGLLQMIFAVLGWLTLLFEPEYPTTPGCICIVRPVDQDGDVIRSNTLTAYKNQIEVVADLPIHQLLRHFGMLIPVPVASREELQAEGVRSDQLSTNYLNYQILSNVAGIKVQFVSSLSLHLEFDKRSKALKIFRYPSFCRLICSGRRAESDELQRSYLKK